MCKCLHSLLWLNDDFSKSKWELIYRPVGPSKTHWKLVYLLPPLQKLFIEMQGGAVGAIARNWKQSMARRFPPGFNITAVGL